MAFPLPGDVDQVRSIVTQVDAGVAIADTLAAEMLDVLEQYECWAPFFRLIKRGLEEGSPERERNYVRLARVQNLYLEDTFAAAESCAALVAHLRPSYLKFSEDMLPHMIEVEDYAAEATLLSAICEHLALQYDHIACLERLCILFEKKTHNESRLAQTYEQLLAKDPRNVRALRYFKLLFTQNNEWDRVVDALTKLLSAVRHPQELYRVAQELAGIYLYQMDMPEAAIAVLAAHCEASPLDTSTILYDAYERLNDWQGCLQVLRQCLLTVESDAGRATLHFRMGGLQLQLGDVSHAYESYQKAAKQPAFLLDALEGLINVSVARQDWAMIEAALAQLQEAVVDERLRGQLQQAQSRLHDGLAHAAKQT